MSISGLLELNLNLINPLVYKIYQLTFLNTHFHKNDCYIYNFNGFKIEFS